MTGTGLDYDAVCPGCGVRIGDHTIEGYAGCLKSAGFDYRLPYADIPDGPLTYPGIDGEMAGEVSVMPGFVDTGLGRMPVLRFVFTAAGLKPMSRRTLPAINLLLDPKGLKAFRQLVSAGVDRAIVAARHGR
jgi:hypothetical protein